jgi:hypothetical protein
MSFPEPWRTVFKEKPFDLSYAEAMNRLRVWLDRNKITAHAFKITAGDNTGFELTFTSEKDAAAFEAFEWPR